MWPWQKGPEMTRRDTPEMDIMGPGGTRRDITGGPEEMLLGSQEGCGYGTRRDMVMGPEACCHTGLGETSSEDYEQPGGMLAQSFTGPGGTLAPAGCT